MEQVTSTAGIHGYFVQNRVWFKGLLIGMLILLMLIPAAFVSNLVQERAARQEEVAREVSSKWAGAQTVTGPVLVVPYYVVSTDEKGETSRTVRQAYFLPDKLGISCSLRPEVRHRSLYDVTLYRSQIRLDGAFTPPDIRRLQLAPEQMIWEDARLLVGIGDARGLEEEISLSWNNDIRQMEAGIPANEAVQHGLNAPVAIDAQTPVRFSMDIRLKGSGHLYLTPAGKTTNVVMSAPWKDPAFDGQYLPSETPSVSEKGFTARWKIMDVSRSYPQSWKDGSYDIGAAAFGVKLLQPVDSYAKTDRSVKYALLFISLTFAVFFFLEIRQKKQIHPLQYILVGFALCIFYTLLLSVSEYTGFNPAYAIAATATVLLVGMYTWSIFRSRKTGLGFSLALTMLYAYIFILIQLQDYALLFGSIGLFCILAGMMYYSRKIDWYHTGKQSAG